MTEMTCRSGVDLLADYLEDLLSPEMRASVERHVLACERCQAFVASYKATPAILRHATDVAVPDDLRARLRTWLETERRGV